MKKLLLQNKVLAVVIHTVALITTIVFALVLYKDEQFRTESFKVFIFAVVLFLASLGVYSKIKENFQMWGKDGAPVLLFWTQYPLANLNLSIATAVLAVRLMDPTVSALMGAATADYLNFLNLSAYPQVYPLLAALAVTVLVLTSSQTSLLKTKDMTTKVVLVLVWVASILVLLATVFTVKDVPLLTQATMDDLGVITNLLFQYLLQVLWLKELLYKTSALVEAPAKKRK